MGETKTSTACWKNSLSQRLQKAAKTALVGVGHELRGDDAAGVLVARALLPFASRRLLVVEAAHAPENVTGVLRRFAPQLILFVDAAQMDDIPGSVRLIDWREAGGFGGSTHTLPLSTLAAYLTHDLACDVLLLGIQPGTTDFGASVSSPVQQAVESLVAVIRLILEQNV